MNNIFCIIKKNIKISNKFDGINNKFKIDKNKYRYY
jgi:hypothetical protein